MRSEHARASLASSFRPRRGNVTAMSREPVCVVVDVGPGNGAAFARRFAREGYRIALLARQRALSEELEKALPGSRAYACDVSDVAETAFHLVKQPRSAWSFEVEARPFAESW